MITPGDVQLHPKPTPKGPVRSAIVIEDVKREQRKETESERLVATISSEGVFRSLFFEVPEDLGEYFDEYRADCFVVALLAQAAMDGHDIKSHVPVSERLLFQLNTFLCGVLAKIYKQQRITISASTAPVHLETAGAVGTGLTCGVDSLYTVAKYSKTGLPHHDLTHLCLFDVGSHHIAAEPVETINRYRISLATQFCEQFGYTFVGINSNLNEFAPQYTRYYSLLNAAAAMSLPKLFSHYYSSSGYSVDTFHLTAKDISHFEIFVLDAVSTLSLKFYSTGAEVPRFEKVKALVKFEPSFKYLNVCNTHSENCGVCVKCLRTLYALDILEALDAYRNVFDIENYRINRKRYMADCWTRVHLARDSFAAELYPHLKKKYGGSVIANLRAAIRFVAHRCRLYSFAQIRARLSEG